MKKRARIIVGFPGRRSGRTIPGRAPTARSIRLFSVLFSCCTPALAAPVTDESSGFLAEGLLIVLAIFGLAAIVVTAVTLWSRRLDHVNDMMSFCMRYLIDFHRVAEGREAAAALGRARDPQALLVLLDVVNDEDAADVVRAAAAEGLSEMTQRYRKYRKVIEELKSASEKRDHSQLIEILTKHFEKGQKKYVQSAYIIGREHMRGGHYAAAKEWLHVAEFRNKKTPMYASQIERLIAECNENLFAAGDTLFRSGKYYEARERYSAGCHALSEAENKRYFGFLRLACVYCRLGDYEDADQAILQALKQGQDTDSSLALNKLLQDVLGGEQDKNDKKRKVLVDQIDDLTTEVMSKLYVAGLDRFHRGEPAPSE